jgi:predicted outer membrane repeat protein
MLRSSLDGSGIAVVSLFAAAITLAADAGEVRFVRTDGPANGDGTSWRSAYSKVFSALDEAANDPSITQIWIAEGVYTPDRGQKNRNDTFTLAPGVTLYGGFTGAERALEERDPAVNVTVLSGDLKGDDGLNFTKIVDNSFHVLTASGFTGSPATLDGLTVRGGNANLDPDDLLGGGGVFITSATVVVKGCVFTANSAGINQPSIGGFGGAIYNLGGELTASDTLFTKNRGDSGGAFGLRDLNDSPYSAIFTNCQFIANTANHQTGGAIWTGANPFDTVERTLEIHDCLFEDNSAQYGGAIIDNNTKHFIITGTTFRSNEAFVVGGAMWHNQSGGNDQEPMFITGCTFEGNVAADHGGAIFLTLSDAVITSSRFIGNIAEDGVGGAIRTGPQFGTSFGVGDLHLANCLFTGNDALFGGAVFASRCPIARIAHCTFAHNTATQNPAGLFSDSFDIAVDGSIFWENSVGASTSQTAQILHQSGFGPLNLNHSCVQGLTGSLGGQGNTGADPLFVDANGSDNVFGSEDDDLTLQIGSPLVDAATADSLPADVADLDGDGDTAEPLPHDLIGGLRVLGSAPDMGAFEQRLENVTPDLTGDGAVDGGDLGILLSNWGGAGLGDLNQDGQIDGLDLGLLLAAWTG